MLATKKGSQVTKNMPSRTPRVRLAFKAFLLCLVAKRLLSTDSAPGHGVLGTCGKEGHVTQLRKSPCPALIPPADRASILMLDGTLVPAINCVPIFKPRLQS